MIQTSTSLQTPGSLNGGWTSDASVLTYNLNGQNYKDVETSHFNTILIPSTSGTVWTTSIAPAKVYQAHYVVTNIVPIFEDIEIAFNTIHVGANASGPNATVLNASSLEEDAYIVFGEDDNNNSAAVFDIAGHELGHVFLNTFLDYTNLGNATLHEGISDMLGAYAESVIQGGVDWQTGDDSGYNNGRNLEDPQYDCYDVIENSSYFSFGNTSGFNQHAASTPLGYWFYLISEGNGGSIPSGIGIDNAIQIILEALPSLSRNADWNDLRDAVMVIVDEEFEPCSVENSVIRSAWHEICVGPDHFTDCFTIEGNAYPCEEEDYLYLYIGNPTPGVDVYRWTFPIEWTVQGNPSGNTYVGHTFIVTDFPDYDWYPRYFNIRVYSPLLGTNYTQFKRIKLIDCDGDDPTCDEFYTKSGTLIGSSSNDGNKFKDDSILNIKTLKVFNVMGQTLFTGVPSAFNENAILYQGMIVFAYLDESGKVVKTQKRILMK